jgi:hypothetical protein
MIAKKTFDIMQNEVLAALNEVFDLIRKASPENFILILADSEYKSHYELVKPPLNPYVISDTEDKTWDENRMQFLIEFLRTFYSFPPDNEFVDDSPVRMNMEMMIYAHIWESKSFLKTLFRLARLCDNMQYDWKVSIPPMSKHKFIRFSIRDIFKARNLSLSNVMTKGFHTSLRNAFAHSEFAFDFQNNRIWLENVRNKNIRLKQWKIYDLSFDEWTIRFSYSVLLNYHLFNQIYARRATLVKDFGTDTFIIDHPSSKHGTNRVKIIYHQDNDAFGFV